VSNGETVSPRIAVLAAAPTGLLLRAFLLAAGSIAGCGDGGAQVANSVDAVRDNSNPSAAAHCTSGVRRDPNESEGPEMLPGHACTSCHAQSNAASGEGDAPIFAFAGTLFPSPHEPDDCVGSASEGATVTITGADGMTFSATANTSGNFFLETNALELPFTAQVAFEGRRRRMAVPQSVGDCNECHTVRGNDGAPGRILLP
jgi:hypothetical protein